MTNTKETKPTLEQWLAKRKVEELKRKQAQWDYEDRSGETEAAIERERFYREEE